MTNENNFSKKLRKKGFVKNKNRLTILLIIIAIIVGVGFKTKLIKPFWNKLYINIKQISNMNTSRAFHKSLLLKDGRILIFGGFTSIDGKNDTLEILDLKKNQFKLLSDKFNLISEDPIVLKDGRVVFFQKTKTTIFDPTTNKLYDKKGILVPVDIKNGARITTVLLNNGEILVLGPLKALRISSENPVEIFDPITNTFTLLKNKIFIPAKYKETHHYSDINGFIPIDCIKLNNGKILAFLKSYYKNVGLSVQVFDPNTEKFSIVKGMNLPRDNFKSILLKNGKVLILGGYDDNGKIVKQPELFNPKNNSFSPIPSMLYSRQYFNVLPLKNGNVLIIGGYDENKKDLPYTEIYNLKTNNFEKYVKLNFPRIDAKATELENNKFIVYNGFDPRTETIVVPYIEICNKKNCKYVDNNIFHRYHYDLLKIKDNTYLFTGGGDMISSRDSFIKTLNDAYVIKF